MLVVAAAALVDGGGRVLVQKRPMGSDHAGLWEFPGGKLEAHETPRDALVRELREELGIVVDPLALSPAGFASEQAGPRHLPLLLFICREWMGVPQKLQAAELRWLDPHRLHTLTMPPADLRLLGPLESLLRGTLD